MECQGSLLARLMLNITASKALGLLPLQHGLADPLEFLLYKYRVCIWSVERLLTFSMLLLPYTILLSSCDGEFRVWGTAWVLRGKSGFGSLDIGLSLKA